MDLGDFFGGVVDLGTSYFQSKFQPAPMGFAGGDGGFSGYPPDVFSTGYGPVGAGPPGPPPPNGGGGPCGPPGPSPVWKKVCGEYKWVYPKRRRRKQLLTQSDAKGLSQLKGIVGAGKTMEVWIATHGD